MKRQSASFSGLAPLLVVFAALLVGSGSVLAASHDIAIVDFEFQPDELTVLVGEPVTWTNNANRNHTVTSDQGTELDGNPVLPGEAYGHVFEVPGTYTYHCEIHPEQMTGTIVVQAAPATPPPSGSPEPTPPPGNLPSDFVPFPSFAPIESSAAAATSTPAPIPSGAINGDALLVLLAALGALGLGGAVLMIALRRRGRPG